MGLLDGWGGVMKWFWVGADGYKTFSKRRERGWKWILSLGGEDWERVEYCMDFFLEVVGLLVVR